MYFYIYVAVPLTYLSNPYALKKSGKGLEESEFGLRAVVTVGWKVCFKFNRVRLVIPIPLSDKKARLVESYVTKNDLLYLDSSH